MIINAVESTEESGESDIEWQDDPLSQSAAATPSQSSSHLHDSLVEEEQETSQPLVLNTVPVTDVCPNRENLEREETVMVEKFLSDGCGCDLVNGGCSSTFTADSLESYRRECSELTRAELDMALLGQLVAFTNSSTLTVHTTKDRHRPETGQKLYRIFWHGGRRICKKTFLFLHTISEKRLRNLQQSLGENGLAPRQHGNLRRVPSNTISFAKTQRVVEFLTPMQRPMPSFFLDEFQDINVLMCNYCHPARQSGRCGSSTVHH